MPQYSWTIIGGEAKIVDASGKPVSFAIQQQVLQNSGWDFSKIPKWGGITTTPKEGDTRINPTTGQTETFDPEGNWRVIKPVTTPFVPVTGGQPGEVSTGNVLQPKGTVLRHADGSTSTADGNTQYDMSKWSVVSDAPVVTTGAGATDWQTILNKQYTDLEALVLKLWGEKTTTGSFTWTDEDTARVKAEFDELYAPYYEQMRATAKLGAREAVEEIGKAEELAVTRQTRSLEEALTDSRASMASRGLAFSGIKEEAIGKAQVLSAEEIQRIIYGRISKN